LFIVFIFLFIIKPLSAEGSTVRKELPWNKLFSTTAAAAREPLAMDIELKPWGVADNLGCALSRVSDLHILRQQWLATSFVIDGSLRTIWISRTSCWQDPAMVTLDCFR